MKKQLKPNGKFSLAKELTRSELKLVVGGGTTQTYCSDGWPNPGATPIGCAPAYCVGAHHGTFLYCL